MGWGNNIIREAVYLFKYGYMLRYNFILGSKIEPTIELLTTTYIYVIMQPIFKVATQSQDIRHFLIRITCLLLKFETQS